MNQINVVGIGPGGYEQMTLEAVRCLEACDVIVGYTAYVELVRPHFPDKEFLSTPMRREEARCRLAFDQALMGKRVAVVCTGDAGVYGMAGLMHEVGESYPPCQLRVIPGVTAALAGAAVLGAPLVHDFVLISLSDLLTPWETIARRLECAAAGDFVICLYNPSSRKRWDYLEKACRLVLAHESPDTVCGVVSNIGREGERMELMRLEELAGLQADMSTTVFIGNSQTRVIGGRMVTPRGYRLGTFQSI